MMDKKKSQRRTNLMNVFDQDKETSNFKVKTKKKDYLLAHIGFLHGLIRHESEVDVRKMGPLENSL
ncbi:hypothetical protein Hanom_Chr10g00944931 [Helianthus anomalus]